MNHSLPNLIIAGVNKAGTTSLFSYLTSHPEICGSSVKETCYFLPIRYHEPLQPLASYGAYFTSCKDTRYRLEATPGYFYGGEPLARSIRDNLGEVRVLLVFREPVDRLLSFFAFQKSMVALDADLTLAEYLRRCQSLPDEERRSRENNPYWGIDGGYYDLDLPAWQQVFGGDLKVAFFEDLKRDRQAFLADLCAWLELDPGPFEQLELAIENRTVGYRNRHLQRLALALNRSGERLWRRAPAVKQALKRGYRMLNGRAAERDGDDASLELLQHLYRPHNTRLAEQLLAAGHSRLPEWLGR